MRKRAFLLGRQLAQRLVFTLEQFNNLELANHAAAGAYAFLLSLMPALLVVVYVLSRVYAALNLDVQTVHRFLEPYIGAFITPEITRAFLGKPLTGLAGLLGAINLLWASRLFVVSIQRGMRVIFRKAAPTNALRENILTFVVEILLLFSVIVLIAASQVLLGLSALVEWRTARLLLGSMTEQLVRLVPLLALWLFVFLTYLSVPRLKLERKQALLCALTCVVAYWLLSLFLGVFLSTARYGVLYGLLGNVVSALLKVFCFFWLYYFCAMLAYTGEYFDAMLFSRFCALRTGEQRSGWLNRLLFSHPARLFRQYARLYRPGELLFSKGDPGKETLYLESGRVGIYLAPPPLPTDGKVISQSVLDVSGDLEQAAISVIMPGQFFGEMSAMLDECRTAWAVALSDVTILQLPSELFNRHLSDNPAEARRLIEQLAERLKRNNEQLTQGEEA